MMPMPTNTIVSVGHNGPGFQREPDSGSIVYGVRTFPIISYHNYNIYIYIRIYKAYRSLNNPSGGPILEKR